MSAPVSMLPGAANDARPARPAYFATKGGAISHAHDSARAKSPTGTITGVARLRDMYRAVEGGTAFEVVLTQFGDWHVREVTEYELVRRQQAGMRAEVEREYAKALEHERDALAAREGSSLQRFHKHYAAEHRDRARTVEAQLTISGVRQVEPFLSPERDNRKATSR